MGKTIHDAIAIVGKVESSYTENLINEIGRCDKDAMAKFVANKLRLTKALALLTAVVEYPNPE